MEQRAILAAVEAGEAEWEWTSVTFQEGPHTLTYRTFPDAMKLGGVRFGVTAQTAQRIADMIGAILPTPKLEDMTWRKCNTLLRAVTSLPGPKGVRYMANCADEEHSAAIDQSLAKLRSAGISQFGLLATIGKSWVICKALEHPERLAYGLRTAANYGWHDPAAPYLGATGIKLWQQVGTRHNDEHVDPSQTCRLIGREAELDGQPVDLVALLQDPSLASLISHEGVLKTYRQMSVPSPENPILVLPPTRVTG